MEDPTFDICAIIVGVVVMIGIGALCMQDSTGYDD